MNAKILTLTILSAILILTFANTISASVYEPVYVYQGEIDSNGNEIKTTDTITDVSAVMYTCEDENCETAERLWENTFNTGNDNVVVLTYPTILASDYGYLVYFYNEDSIPYAYRVAKAQGDGRAPDRNVYLYKEYLGKAEIENFAISDSSIKTGETATITADILSPMENLNDWYVPEEVKGVMNDEVKITLTANGNIIETKTLEIDWSTEQEVEFTFTPSTEGTYTIKLTSEVTSDKFLNTEKQEKTATLIVSGNQNTGTDTTSPLITIISPENGKTYTQILNYFHFNVYDASSVTCQYSIDDGNKVTTDCKKGFAILISNQGTNKWTLYAEDAYGNKAEKSVTFKIDLFNGDVDGNGRIDVNNRGYKQLYDEDNLEEQEYYNQFNTPTTRTYLADDETTTQTTKSVGRNVYLISFILIAVVILLILILIMWLKR